MEQADAENLTIPHIVLASKDEPGDIVDHYTDILARNGIGGHVETYTTMWHGWMGARARLDEKEGSAEYIRGYVNPSEDGAALTISDTPRLPTFSKSISNRCMQMYDGMRFFSSYRISISNLR
jgi:hypothetical protein